MVRPGGLEPLTPTMSRLKPNSENNDKNQYVRLIFTVYKNRYFRENKDYNNQ